MNERLLNALMNAGFTRRVDDWGFIDWHNGDLKIIITCEPDGSIEWVYSEGNRELAQGYGEVELAEYVTSH